MKTIFYPLLVFISVMVTTSCTKARPEPWSLVLIPGECINDNKLQFAGQGIFNYSDIRFLTVGFKLGLTGGKYQVFEPLGCACFKPSDELFNTFGDNASTVSALYEDTWRKLSWNSDYSTVFYNSGMSLTADQFFAGFSPGDNITKSASYFQYNGDAQATIYIANIKSTQTLFSPEWNIDKPFGEVFEESYCIGSKGFIIFIPADGFQEVDEDVTFNLSVPVKVGLYLTWLNDKISDPDAPFPYRDETLTCTFTIHKGLR